MALYPFSSPSKFPERFRWAAAAMPAITDILRQNALHLVNIEVASPDEDLHEATDLKINVTGGKVAVRVRGGRIRYRDFTVRSGVISRQDTELQKFRRGIIPDWYLYAWVCEDGALDWWLLNVRKMHAAGLFDQRRSERSNGDGTRFVAYAKEEIKRAGAFVAEGTWKSPTTPQRRTV